MVGGMSESGVCSVCVWCVVVRDRPAAPLQRAPDNHPSTKGSTTVVCHTALSKHRALGLESPGQYCLLTTGCVCVCKESGCGGVCGALLTGVCHWPPVTLPSYGLFTPPWTSYVCAELHSLVDRPHVNDRPTSRTACRLAGWLWEALSPRDPCCPLFPLPRNISSFN